MTMRKTKPPQIDRKDYIELRAKYEGALVVNREQLTRITTMSVELDYLRAEVARLKAAK